MRLGVISDTHGRLRAEVFTHFDGVDRILHAGDIGDPDILIELAAIAPVTAVSGNVDGSAFAANVPEVARLEAEGRRIVVVHGHRLGSPTPELLRQAHPEADIVVFGHTHVPAVRWIDDRLFLNPGAAGPARFRLKPSIALLRLEDRVHVDLIEI
jgi:putative phosphoesterase